MQQFCNNCGAAIQPGSAVCTNCGASVSGGSGGYDPTMRAGSPPGSGYGSQPYGPPPSTNYGAGAPPPPPQGGFGGPSYGAPPPPPQGFGGPPAPPPGFGGQPPYGGPPPMMPIQQPPQKKSRTLWYVLGGIAALLIICCVGGGIALQAGLFKASQAIDNDATQIAQTATAIEATATSEGSNTGGPFQQTSQTGAHITDIHTGTDFDENTGEVVGESGTFTTSDTVWVVYTVTDPDPGAQVILKLYSNDELQDTSDPVDLDTTTNTYANSITLANTGVHKVEIYYNGSLEAFITFDITS